jgi:hypothetical protein
MPGRTRSDTEEFRDLLGSLADTQVFQDFQLARREASIRVLVLAAREHR